MVFVFNKRNFWHLIKFGESLHLGSLLNQSQTYQGNPCGIYLDLSSFTGSGVFPDLSSFTRSGIIQKLYSLYQAIRPVRFTSQSLVIDYQITVIDYTKLLCERMRLFTFEFEFQRSKALVINYQNIVIDYSLLKLIGTL